MRAIVSRQQELLDWIGSEPSIEKIKLVVNLGRDKAVFCGNLKRTDFLQLLTVLESERAIELWESFFEEALLVFSDNPDQLEDEKLKVKDFDSFYDLMTSDEIEESYKIHSTPMRVNESRDSGFDRLFGHLLPGTEIFELVDPFVGEKILHGESVMSWLLKVVNRNPKCSIRVVSKFPTPKEGPFKGKSRDKILEALFVELNALHGQLAPGTKLYVDLFQDAPHNRFVHLKFAGGAEIFCGIAHGVDAFKEDKISELEPIVPIETEVISDIGQSTRWVPKRNALKQWDSALLPVKLASGVVMNLSGSLLNLRYVK